MSPVSHETSANKLAFFGKFLKFFSFSSFGDIVNCKILYRDDWDWACKISAFFNLRKLKGDKAGRRKEDLKVGDLLS